MEGDRRSGFLGSGRISSENKTTNTKASIYQLMNKMFIDTSATDTKMEYINKKSEEFDEKIKKSGYRNSSLDLRSFEKFYNESNAKSEFAINKIYEFFLNYMKNNTEEQDKDIYLKKIKLFQKMLYIFFETNDEKIKIARLINNFSKKEKEILEKLYKEKNIENIEVKNNIIVNENNLENKNTFTLVKGQVEWIKEIEKKENEIKEILGNIEYYQDIEDNESVIKEEIKKKQIEQDKEQIKNKINEYQELIEQNFIQKEAICKLLNMFLLSIDNAIEQEENNENKIEIGTKENSYENLLELFRLILENSHFKVKELTDEEFLEFLVKNKAKLTDVFTIILTEVLKTAKKKNENITLENLFEYYNIAEEEKDKKSLQKDEQLFKNEVLKTINYENARKKIINYIKRNEKEIFLIFNDYLKAISELHFEIIEVLEKNFLNYEGTPKKALNLLIEYFNLNLSKEDEIDELKQNLRKFYEFKNKKFFSKNKNGIFDNSKKEIGMFYDYFDKINLYDNTNEQEFNFERKIVVEIKKELEKEFLEKVKQKISEEEIKFKDKIKELFSKMIFNILNYGKLLQKDSFYYSKIIRESIYKNFASEFGIFYSTINKTLDVFLGKIQKESNIELIFKYDFNENELKFEVKNDTKKIFEEMTDYLVSNINDIKLENLELENLTEDKTVVKNVLLKINSKNIAKEKIQGYFEYLKNKKVVSKNLLKNSKKMFKIGFNDNAKIFSENEVRINKIISTKNKDIKIKIILPNKILVDSLELLKKLCECYFKTIDIAEKVYTSNETIMFHDKQFQNFVLAYMFSLNDGKNNYTSKEFNYNDKIEQEELKRMLRKY